MPRHISFSLAVRCCVGVLLCAWMAAGSCETTVRDPVKRYTGPLDSDCARKLWRSADLVAKCLERERVESAIDSYFGSKVRYGEYRDELVRICARRGLKEGERCAQRAIDEIARVNESLATIKRDVKGHRDQLTLLAICFEGWDGSPRSVLRGTRHISHCVRTKSRYYRLHGRF